MHIVCVLQCWRDWASLSFFSEFAVATAHPHLWRDQWISVETASSPESSQTLETVRCVSLERQKWQSLWHLWINEDNVAGLTLTRYQKSLWGPLASVYCEPLEALKEVHEKEDHLRSEQAIFAYFWVIFFLIPVYSSNWVAWRFFMFSSCLQECSVEIHKVALCVLHPEGDQQRPTQNLCAQ